MEKKTGEGWDMAFILKVLRCSRAVRFTTNVVRNLTNRDLALFALLLRQNILLKKIRFRLSTSWRESYQWYEHVHLDTCDEYFP